MRGNTIVYFRFHHVLDVVFGESLKFARMFAFQMISKTCCATSLTGVVLVAQATCSYRIAFFIEKIPNPTLFAHNFFLRIHPLYIRFGAALLTILSIYTQTDKSITAQFLSIRVATFRCNVYRDSLIHFIAVLARTRLWHNKKHLFICAMPCNMEFPATPEELIALDSANWKEILEDNTKWHSIPLLNHTPLHKLKDQGLVRFRGMVQDMMGPEIYLERYELKTVDGGTRLQQGKYRDCLRVDKDEQVDYNAAGNVHGERQTLFVVSLPGQNDWAKEYEKRCNPQINQQTEVGSGTKRALDEQEDMEVDKTVESISSSGSSLKRHCVEAPGKASTEESSSSASATLGSDYLLNSPIPDRPSMACMVKVYEDFDKFSLNSLIDFVGFLSVDPALDVAALDMDAMRDVESLSELQAQNPSPFLIPRLHAFAIKPLSHANPLLDRSLQQPAEHEMPSPETLHKDLRMLLKLCLFDDELAAEYLLSHLISTVYSRSEMQSIGKFALNICNLPKDCLQQYTTKLYDVLQLLLPASHYLPMTLDTMNTAAFAPK